MAELITSLVGFVFDNIGFIIGLLVVFLGISSSKKKKKQSQKKAETQGKPFRDIMAELQRELEEEKDGDFKPQIPYDPPRKTDSNRPWSTHSRQEAPMPKRRGAVPAQPQPRKEPTMSRPVQAVTPHTVVHQPHIHVRDDASAPSETVQTGASSPLTALNQLSGDDLVRGVVMAEVLGQPKALRD